MLSISPIFDVVAWLKSEMRMMLDEELARAYLIGDGRLASSDDKINEQNIRPILKDEELYTIPGPLSASSLPLPRTTRPASLFAPLSKARKNYGRGFWSGLLCTPLEDMFLPTACF